MMANKISLLAQNQMKMLIDVYRTDTSKLTKQNVRPSELNDNPQYLAHENCWTENPFCIPKSICYSIITQYSINCFFALKTSPCLFCISMWTESAKEAAEKKMVNWIRMGSSISCRSKRESRKNWNSDNVANYDNQKKKRHNLYSKIE